MCRLANLDGGDDRGIGDPNAMMRFVAILDAAQDHDRVLDRRLGDSHRLKPPQQRLVAAEVLLVLGGRRRTDAA